MKKKFFTVVSFVFILSVVFMFTVNGTFAAILTDIDGHENETAIQFLTDLNIVRGYPDGTFKPDQGINRAEILKILFESSDEPLAPPLEPCFPDVPVDEWFAVYVCSAYTIGYVEGYPDGNFLPGKNVNKAEAIKLLAMFAEWDLSEASDEPLFDDTPETEWYASFLKYAKMKELIEYKENTYGPGEDMPRGSVAESVFRTALVKYMGSEKYTPDQVILYLTAFWAEKNAQQESGEASDEPLIPKTDTNGETGDDTSDGSSGDGEVTPVLDCSNAEDALQVVVDRVVNVNTYKDQLAVYQKDEMLQEDDYFGYFDTSNEGQIVKLGEDEEKWLHWIDYFPEALFFHDTKLVMVNPDCTYEEYNTNLFPLVNGDALWSTMEERLDEDEIDHKSEEVDELLLELLKKLTEDDPHFGTCGADPNELKRAVVMYLGEDTFIKRNAVNWYTFLCNNNYITTVITDTDSRQVLADLEAELREIEQESHDTGFRNFHFHVSSHGFEGSGDLFVNYLIKIPYGEEEMGLLSDKITLDELTALFGDIAFTVGEGGIWSDSYTIIHDTCFSGHAVEKYQEQAYISGERETAVGWMAAAAWDDQTASATLISKQGHNFTKAMSLCIADHSGYPSLFDCFAQKMIEIDLFFEFPIQTPKIEKLSPLTDDYVPFFP